MSLPVAILAGGLATRLRAITERIPKSLVEVAGRPFVEHQLALLQEHGLGDVILLVGHMGDMVRDALGDGSRYGLRLRYVFDGPQAGTGGAVRRALAELGPEFFVLYGDSYLECDYAAIERKFRSSGKSGLMTVYRNEDRLDSSNVVYAEGRILRYDKQRRLPEMRHIDYGLGAFRASAFAGRSDGEAFDLVSVYQELLAKDDLAAYEVATRFYEIGSLSGLEETRAHLRSKGIGVR